MRLVKFWCAIGILGLVGCGRAELFAPEDGAVRMDSPSSPDLPRTELPVTEVPRVDVRDVPEAPPFDCRTGLVCPMQTPLCRMDTGECIQCFSDINCPRGSVCRANRCEPTLDCRLAESCTPERPVCRGDTGECVQCVNNSQCPRDSRCADFTCRPSCGDRDACVMGQTCCASACVSASVDPSNCGGCGVACAPGARCVDGMCAVRPGCGMGPECTPGTSCCGARCADLRGDTEHCGRCGLSCSPGESCVAGRCVGVSCGRGPPCVAGTTCCGDLCLDTQVDSSNCGFCGRSCGPGGRCSSGTCVGGCLCPAGLSCCGPGCTDLQSDPSNCGACGRSCGRGESCLSGRCNLFCACPAGLNCCGPACVNFANDPTNCGVCGNRCAPGAMCLAGRCQTVMCAPGTADCDGDPTNRCEANLVSDPLNCGSCGLACGPGGRCVMGRCTVMMGCNGGPNCAPGLSCCADGCLDVSGDVQNCGACGTVCPSPTNTTRTCVSGRCGIGACTAGFGDCNGNPADGCEVNLATDAMHCGSCRTACAAGLMCVGRACSMSSMGREGAFMPTVNPTFLTPGLHDFTTITVPSGVVVYLAGGGGESGLLDLRATGDVRIDGTIDVSGGPGGQSTITSRSTRQGRAGAGGFTGDPRTATAGPACEWIGGVSGGNGRGLVGSLGTCRAGSNQACITDAMTQLIFASPIAQFGGGAGVFSGYRAYGAGGGGYAGGAPGALGPAYMGQMDCTGVSAGGGAQSGRGGNASVTAYNGRDGALGQTQCPGTRADILPGYVGGGGGGSVGPAAAMDLPIATSFQPGSGGGGGSADYLNRPAFGGTSGGGGGGGAVRIWSQTVITVTGRILANGGDGGDAYIGTNRAAGCDPQPGAAGGGGSGGLIFLRAPAITTGPRAQVTAAGGLGGAGSLYATGGSGGNGGIGRIRLSVSPSRCSLAGALTPTLLGGCAVTPGAGTAGRAYIAAYPD